MEPPWTDPISIPEFDIYKKHELVGAPLDKPKFTNEVIGVVKWVDGTVLDSIFKVAH